MRNPSLDDYDSGAHKVLWAEYVGAIAHPCYDEFGAVAEYVPVPRVPKEAAADAWFAEQRYQAYRARARVEEESARAQRAKLLEDSQRLAAEKRRVQHEQRDVAAEAARTAEERRQRWLKEEREWRQRERLRELERLRSVEPKHIEAWGGDVRIYVIESAHVRWNKHPEEGSIALSVGEVWRVSAPLAAALRNAGKAEAF